VKGHFGRVGYGRVEQTSRHAKQPWQGAAPVKTAGAFSPWGAMAQEGNVHEYCDGARDGVNDVSAGERLLFFSSYWNAGGRTGFNREVSPTVMILPIGM